MERLAERMAEHDIAWLEEPMPPDNHEAYLRLKEKESCPWPAESMNRTKSVTST